MRRRAEVAEEGGEVLRKQRYECLVLSYPGAQHLAQLINRDHVGSRVQVSKLPQIHADLIKGLGTGFGNGKNDIDSRREQRGSATGHYPQDRLLN